MATVEIPTPKSGGGGGGGTDYPWQKFTGLTLAGASNPDSYLTAIAESSPGRYLLTVDATVPSLRDADSGCVWDLGADSGLDLLSELSAKSDPRMWVLEVRVTVNTWPSEIVSNHWVAVGIPETPTSTAGLTCFCYLRDANGSLEPMVFGNWGNNAFTPGIRSVGVANHFQSRFRLRTSDAGVDSSAEVIAHQAGTLSLAHNFDAATGNTDWTLAKLLLSVQHESVGLNAADTIDLTIEGRILPIDYDFA